NADESVTEMAHAGEYHGDIMGIRSRDDFVVTNGAAWLDDGRNAHLRSGFYPVLERKEGVRCHDRASNLESLIAGLDIGDLGAIDPAHLTCTDADRTTLPGIYDRVGLDELGDLPGEQHIVHFLFCRLTSGHCANVVFADDAKIAILNQQSTGDPLVVECRLAHVDQFTTGQDANVRLAGEGLEGVFTE